MPDSSIAPILRQIPTLSPEDTLSRALSMLRYAALDTLPVVDAAGRLTGIVTLQDLRPLLIRDQIDLLEPVHTIARRPAATAHTHSTMEDARQFLVASGETTLPVVDESGHYFGVVGFADFIEPIPVQARPSMIGGMATPWGVYLTNGSIQAGVGNRALVGTGLLMGALLAVAFIGIGVAAHLIDARLGADFMVAFNTEPTHTTIASFPMLMARAIPMLVFLLLIRALPLAQFHAAEHQAVHAMERGEPLHPDVVKRMPRVHPRCGTNIMAAGLVFTAGFHGFQILGGGWIGPTDAALIAALTALLTWRRIGGFLQFYFTTKPAGARHIASGLAAAEDLERRFQQAPPARLRILRRIWCMGLPQIMLGVTISATATVFALEWAYSALAR